MVTGVNRILQRMRYQAAAMRLVVARACDSARDRIFSNKLICRYWPEATRPVRLFVDSVARMRRVYKQAVLIMLLLPGAVAHAVAPGTSINNTASASYSVGGVPGFTGSSNTDSITTTIALTPATIEFYQYNTAAPTLTTTQAITSSYADGSAAGAMVVMANPDYSIPGAGPTPLDVANPVPLSLAVTYHTGEPVFVMLTDSNRNIDRASRDIVRVSLSVSATGDAELIEFNETGLDTGVFVGYIQSTSVAATVYDGQLTVAENQNIDAAYTDIYDTTDNAAAQVLVDPFGIVFDSTTGTPVNGAIVRIVDAATGLDAVVYGDDGISIYPSTVTTGSTAADSSGTLYTFPPGGYRFPLMAPGTYRFEVTPPTGYSVPSTVPEAVLQALPGAPFAIDANASYLNNFVLNAGPALNVDIPADPSGNGLFLTMTVSKQKVSIGEFVRYTLVLTNNSTTTVSAATVIDNYLPRGLRYHGNSARLNNIAVPDPVITGDGRNLLFTIGDMAPLESVTLNFVAAVDAEADGKRLDNSARASNVAAQQSNLASVPVTVVQELLNTRSHVLGRVMSGNCAAEPVRHGSVDMRLQSEVYGDVIDYVVTLSGNTVPITGASLVLKPAQPLAVLPGSISMEGSDTLQVENIADGVRIILGDPGQQWNRVVRLRARLDDAEPGTYSLDAKLQFNTAAAQNVTVTAVNTVLREKSTGERKSLVTLSEYEKIRIEPSLAGQIELNTLIKEIKGRTVKRVRIMGHTDNVSSGMEAATGLDDNYELSLERAKAAARHLRKYLEFDVSRLQVQGFGPDMPVADNATAAGRRSNRRVEVEIITTHNKTEYQNTALRGDSGLRRAATETLPPEKTDAVLGGELKGVAGVRIVTEQGIYAVTDRDGLYHIEGLRPGTHVLQVDEASLPDDLEVMLCEENTRFAGSGNSRFVDLQGGSLWRSDFYLKKKDPLKAKLDVQMRSELDDALAHFTVDVSGLPFDYRNASVMLVVPDELKYVDGSLFVDNKLQPDPKIENGVFSVWLGNHVQEAWAHQVRFSTRAAGTRENSEIVTRAVAMFQDAGGSRFRTPYAENSLLHTPGEATQQQFIFRPRFSSARAELKQTDRIRLDRIIGQFKAADVVHIRVVGHADNIPLKGKALDQWGDNTALSRARAAAVADYIKQQLKLVDGQMSVDALGDSQPIADNDTQEGRAINRRVELFVRTRQENEAGIWKQVTKDNCPVYITAQYELDEDNLGKVDDLAKTMSGQRIRRIRVVGHTDTRQMTKVGRQALKDNYELSRLRAEGVAVRLRDRLGLDPNQVLIEVLGPAQPLADNSSQTGRAQNRRVEVFVEHVDMKDMAQQKPDWKLVRADSGVQSVKLERDVSVSVTGIPEAPGVVANVYGDIDEAWLQKAVPGIDWLAPQPGFMPAIPSVRVAIKHANGQAVELSLNGKPVSALNRDTGIKDVSRGIEISRWRGVDLQRGDNRMTAIVRDAAGNIISTLERTLKYVDEVARAIYVQDYSRTVANGRDDIIVALRLLDHSGQPVRPGVTGRFTVSEPFVARSLADELKHNPVTLTSDTAPAYVVAGDGIAMIRIKPTTQSGKLSVRLNLGNDRQQDVDVWVAPAQRDWVLVGLAEGTAGYRTLEGNMTALEEIQAEEGYYDDGRLAFYAKGSIKGEWLLTAAYDSAKQKDTPDAVLHGLVEPDQYYTLYGDGAERRHDAASTSKLYVKLERRQFYALFGDYTTGMTVTELSRYSRSMTGLKSEYNGEKFSYNVFVSETETGFVKDEIRGDGTSGLYRLSRQNIVANSDKVVIETRDRFNSHVVLNRQNMARFLDYNIDPVAGTLYFRQPVFTQDSAFNPVYIVIDYEVETGGDSSVVAGGRAAVKMLEGGIEIGASAVHEGIEGAEANLSGIDATIQLGEHSRLRAEAATTDQQQPAGKREGDAWMAEYEYADEKLNARLYMREQDEGFGLGQQPGTETGTRKLGAAGRYALDDAISIQAELRHEDVLGTDAQRDMAQASIHYSQDSYTVNGGLRRAADEDGSGVERESEQLTLGGAYFFLNKRASVRANAEVGLGDNAEANPDYPSRYVLGGDYRITQATRLFLEQEWTRGLQQDTEATRAGFETSPWQGAAVRSDVGNRYSESGARTYSSLGLKQAFRLSDHISLDLGYDRRKTLREPGDTPFNVNVPPANGTLDNDYSAVSAGMTYKAELWSATARAEGRASDKEDKNTVLFGFYRENRQGVGFAARYNWFAREEASGVEESRMTAELSLAWRPADSYWNVLDKLKAVDNDRVDDGAETLGRKYVNNLNLNYLVGRRGQLALHWGYKQVVDSFDNDEYEGVTQAGGLEYRHDLNSWWDIGVQGAMTEVAAANNQRYSYGISTGFNVMRGVWLSLGYNKEGFEDRDFSTAGYAVAGPYLKFRMSFDHYSSRRVMAWWEKDERVHPGNAGPVIQP